MRSMLRNKLSAKIRCQSKTIVKSQVVELSSDELRLTFTTVQKVKYPKPTVKLKETKQ